MYEPEVYLVQEFNEEKTHQPYINSSARLAASLSWLDFEYGIIQLLTRVIPIFPFCFPFIIIDCHCKSELPSWLST